MSNLSTLPTPAILVDQAKLAANILSMQRACDASGIELRPHMKTHKMVDVDALRVGECVAFVPAHVCTAINLTGEITVTEGTTITGHWTVEARSRTQ